MVLRPADKGANAGARFDLLLAKVGERRGDFAKRRRTVKRRATLAAVGTAGGTGLTTLILGLRETFDEQSAALVTAAFVLSAVGTLVAVWDRLFKHSELWVQRTVIVNQLQRLEFEMCLYAASKSGEQMSVADVDEFLDRLNAIDDLDLSSWLSIRGDVLNAEHLQLNADDSADKSPKAGEKARPPRTR